MTSDQFSHLDDLSARRFRDRRLPTRISDTPPRVRQNPSKTSQNQLVKDAVLNHFFDFQIHFVLVFASKIKSRSNFRLRPFYAFKFKVFPGDSAGQIGHTAQPVHSVHSQTLTPPLSWVSQYLPSYENQLSVSSLENSTRKGKL